MHGWCEELATLAKVKPEQVSEQIAEQACGLARQLESLILGEAADSLAAFHTVIEQVRHLAQNGPGDQSSEPTRARDKAPDPQPAATEPSPVEPPSLEPLAVEAPAEAQLPTGPAPAAVAAAPPAVKASYVPEPLRLEVKELDFLKGFVEEAAEHIEAIESAVLEVERSPNDAERIDALFRPFHTIKGMAGFLNLRDIGSLTHEVETLLDQGRKGKRQITPGVIDLVLSVVDVLKAQRNQVAAWVAEPHGNVVPQPPVAELIDRLRAVVSGRLDLNAGARPAGPTAKTAAEATAGEPEPKINESATTASNTASAAASAKYLGDRSIRINTDKLDALVDMVGELVIAQTLVNMNGDIAGNPKLTKDVNQVTKIVRDVQELAMAMRMLPIGPTFQKMARLVRDVSRKAGRQVELTISGDETELDKTVIQEIGDPLVHMVRNAVDHGVESPAARLAAGKPEVGQVHLHAGHEGGNIIIEIRDDGKGLDPAVLAAKAIEKGIVPAGTELSDQEAFALIFAPGFSTAAQVSDISGRGVGMDVVRRNIDQLRGRVEISSVLGRGTTFTIRLPLTLAIIDGMVIKVAGERFIIPTIAIEQSLRPKPEQITTVQHRGEMINVRGRLIPMIQLAQLFGLGARVDPCEAMVLIAHSEGHMVGLVVEELIGQQQVVIKTLGERFEQIKGVSGAAILGDGRVGLILETGGLGSLVHRAGGQGIRGLAPVGSAGGQVAAA